MQAHKVTCRLKNGNIKKYEVDGVDTAQAAREFVISQVKNIRTVLALVNSPSIHPEPLEFEPEDLPPKRYA
jgi:hypothetical protein